MKPDAFDTARREQDQLAKAFHRRGKRLFGTGSKCWRAFVLGLVLGLALGAAVVARADQKPTDPPSVDIYLSDLQAQVDSLRMRVDALEGRRHQPSPDALAAKVRCKAHTKTGRQCKRITSSADSLCFQHRRVK